MIATVISDMQSESFETQRLFIGCCGVEDAPSLSSLMSAEISRWVASWPFPLTLGQCEKMLLANRAVAKEGKAFPGIIIEKNTGRIIGWIKIAAADASCQSFELGYWIGENFQGNGYGFEAASGAVDFAFTTLNAASVKAGAQLANTASHELLRKLGMTEDGETDIWAPSRNQFERCKYWKLDRVKCTAP
ncbi:GNAT family N-acetyltransferase [Ochrobactrum sp. Q0168]|uniref:GNAT family N-acetyltransferase n=1 Tax=Ochrobactrum sp. Q0168 TaxID=2793241 RepID=UPI0018EB122F|nr:GNAT family N-acetyltransferase [Ochrobactrum sp. Q0168]